MNPLELAKKWGYVAALVGLAGFVSFGALAKRPGAPIAAPSPARTANDPVPGVPDTSVRDPFATGAEWRARMREKLEPAPTPSAAVSVRPPAPAGPDFTLMGTMTGGNGGFAVLSIGQFQLGAVVRGFKIEQVELDRVVLSRGSARFVLKVPDSGRPPEETGP